MSSEYTMPSAVEQLCGELGRQAREFYPECDWTAVEPMLQRIWTHEHREIDWITARALIYSVWRDERSNPAMDGRSK